MAFKIGDSVRVDGEILVIKGFGVMDSTGAVGALCEGRGELFDVKKLEAAPAEAPAPEAPRAKKSAL